MSNNPKKRKGEKSENPMNRPWISMHGMIIIAFISIAMVVLTAWQLTPQKVGWMGFCGNYFLRFGLGNFLWQHFT
jgi:hypothetical protein